MWVMCFWNKHGVQGCVSVCIRVNTKGEAMLANLNQTAHLHHDDVFY